MKNLILIAIITVFIAPVFTSCRFLDVDDYFNETLKEDSIFVNKRNFEKYLWGTASYFPEEGAIFGYNYTPGPMATDEGFVLFTTNEFRGMAYSLGAVTPSNMYGMDIWGTMYKIIRKANTMLARIDEVKDMTAIDKRSFMGYIHFTRAYAYYHILMQNGPVVLMGDDILEKNEDISYYDRQRATYNESVDYICSEFEKAAEFLPEEVPVNYFGRPTRGAALGLIARIKLQQASPLFNGKEAARKYFGTWKRKSDGVNYVSQNYNEKLWAEAAMASKRIIDMNLYSLFTVEKQLDTKPLPANVPTSPFPNGAGNIDPFRSYSFMFNGEALAARNPEFIWGRFSNSVLNYTRHSFPKANMGGWSGLCVPQKIIDAYYMADGRDINNSSSAYPYSETGFIGGADRKFSGYLLKGTAHNMYNNREMRFYASIGFSECFWPANSTSESSRKNQVITYYYDGNAGKATAGDNPVDFAVTGYVLKKYIHDDDAWAGTGAQRVDKSFPIIRYAEILLSYVEAINNLTQAYSLEDKEGNKYNITRNINDIKYYFNQVRYRAGLPGLTDAEAADPATVQKLIERERMIEFLFENRRYFDVRRWGIYEETEKELMMGMDTDATKTGYYTRVPINHSRARNRVVDRKLIFMPLNLYDLRKAPSLDQNPGWEN